MDNSEKEENDHNSKYLQLSDSLMPSNSTCTLGSNMSNSNDLCPHPMNSQASGSCHEFDTVSEMNHEFINENEKDLDGNVQTVSKQGKKKMIRPYDLEQSLFYTSFTPEQTLNYQVEGLDIVRDENGIVWISKIPHRISKINRELIPISIEPENGMYFAQLNSI